MRLRSLSKRTRIGIFAALALTTTFFGGVTIKRNFLEPSPRAACASGGCTADCTASGSCSGDCTCNGSVGDKKRSCASPPGGHVGR